MEFYNLLGHMIILEQLFYNLHIVWKTKHFDMPFSLKNSAKK